MSDFLKTMADASRARAEPLPASVPAAALDRPLHALRLGDFDLVAEIKERSPAEGELASGAGPRGERARQYAGAGAAAISVLTEPSRFDGELAHLDEVASLVSDLGVPVMRKDFLVDVRQVVEARVHGASGVLLIAAMLDAATLGNMLDCALEQQMFVLLEAFDEEDLGRIAGLLQLSRYADAAAGNRLLVGVNTRNLRTLAVDTGRLARLAGMLPAGARAVAESGLATGRDAAAVAKLGYRLALVGTALMRSPDPAGLVADMLHSGSRAFAA
ncbi:MAG: indole-3-glycerol-phosphate synthase [Gammaproteobacteria bacterium]|nr:indole-3-glycerol-phosphate synthase [Gammaproteobacteria bacterium]